MEFIKKKKMDNEFSEKYLQCVISFIGNRNFSIKCRKLRFPSRDIPCDKILKILSFGCPRFVAMIYALPEHFHEFASSKSTVYIVPRFKNEDSDVSSEPERTHSYFLFAFVSRFPESSGNTK